MTAKGSNQDETIEAAIFIVKIVVTTQRNN